jgi:1-acyl-sn-glycerol-3-phosphate acyltransferase
VKKRPATKRSVLGNDPFARGAAPRVIAKQRSRNDVNTPERQTVARPPTVPIAAHAQSPGLSADPAIHAQIPEGVWLEPAQAVAHTAAPTAILPEAPPKSFAALARTTATGVFRALASGVGLTASSQQHTDHWGRDAMLAQHLSPLAQWLYQSYFRVQVQGADRLPTGPMILVSNHAGALPLDGPLVHLALKFERPDLPPSAWLLEDQIFHAPIFGTLANRLGAVRANPDNAKRLLEEGRPVIVFPEGTTGLAKPRAQGYRLQRFGRGGYVKIAAASGVPIIPVATVGGNESTPLLATLPLFPKAFPYLPVTLPPLPARWSIAFGNPVEVSPIDSSPESATRVTEINIEVQRRIEALLQQLGQAA